MSKTNSCRLKIGLAKYWAILGFALFLGMVNATQAAVFTGNVSTLWSVPGNWNPIGIPTVAEIPSGKVVDIDMAATVSTLTTQPNSLIRASGGSITVTGTFNCNGGQMGSAATPFPLNISANATMFVAASNAHRWDAVTININNAGKFDWAGGDLRCSALINNNGLMVFHGDGFFGETGIGGLIVNTGRIIKETGTGTTSLYGFNGNDYRLMRINSTGSIAVADGTLEIGAGDNTGDLEVGPQHTLRIKGGPANLSAVAMTGGGTVEINNALGGDIRLIGTIDLAVELKVLTNVIGGDGGAQNQATLRGGGKLTWGNGNLLGEFILDSDFRTDITGGAGRGAANLTNRGTMSWFGPGPVGGLIQNEGTYDLLAPGLFTGFAQNCNIQNRGTLNTFGGGANTSEAGTFVNSGLINVGGYGKAGVLNVYAGFQQTATGSLYMEIGGTNAATPEFDQLLSFDRENIAGKLTVGLINNFNPGTNARFTLINTQNGTFSTVRLPGFERFKIEYPGNTKTDLVSLSDVPLPPLLWGAGRDLLKNESPDNATESDAVNHTVPQWSYGYRTTAASTALMLFTAGQHINDGSGLHGWIANGQATLGVNTRSTPVIFNTGSGNYKALLGGQIYMAPGSGNEFLVARWTAPATGDYRILARWVDIDNHGGNGATAYLFKNGQEQFSSAFQSTANVTGRARLRSRVLSLNNGDTLDFVVGSNGEHLYDATAFNAVIRRIPKVTITAPANGTQITGEQDVTVNVDVEQTGPIASVRLNVDDAENVARDTTAPYSPTARFSLGFHKVTAVAIDSDGAQVESAPILVTVRPPTQQNGPGNDQTKGGPAAPNAQPPSYYINSVKSGSWHDPSTWFPAHVPGRWDMAFVNDGHEVTLDFPVEVRHFGIGGTLRASQDATVQPSLDVYGAMWLKGTLQRIDLYLNGPAGHIYVIGTPSLRFVNFINQSKAVIRAEQINLLNTTIENRGSIQAGPPKTSQGPLVLPLSGLNQTGGEMTIDVNTVVSAPPGAQLNGGINLSPGYAPLFDPHAPGIANGNLITDYGAGLIGDAGSTLVGKDGGSLVGLDGGSVISDAGAGLVGLDGASMVGPDGASLVGNDGGSLVSRTGPTFESPLPASPDATPGEIYLKGGTVTGNGELNGNVINQGAFVRPGNGAGGIVVMGNYTQQTSGSLVLEMGGKTFDPFSYDIFQVSGTATLGGNLIARTINGYTPAPGDIVNPILYGSHTGNFQTVSSNAQVTLGATAGQVTTDGTNPPAARALNISTRLQIQSGDNALFAGFIITGPAGSTKKVLIRGIGPSLAQFGVPGTIPDPFLELHSTGATVTNDNWQQAPNANEIPPGFVPGDSRESVIIATLPPGNYSAILKGAHGETGVGLAEVYDLDPASAAQLANIATRGLVQTGDNVLIGGFIIAGNEPTRVLVRAIGPSLSAFGVQNALQDPTLELHDANGGAIGDDNWRDSQQAEILATSIPPSNDREAAVLATLAPGNYTAVVRGVDDTTGIAVVEAYNLQ